MKLHLLVRIALLACFSISMLAVSNATYAHTSSSIVDTSYGTLKGSVQPSYRLFSDIPYATPPVGKLRWQPPQSPTSWSGVRDATKPSPSCPQLASGQEIGNEDCLYLNVWTPNTTEQNLPVMVWIHGGGQVTGSGGRYDASRLVSQGNVIVVTINYRLGALGYLALPGLSAKAHDHASGDYGIMDQQQALKWVKKSIKSFGGNPHNVTIFGESAGGRSVCIQLVSPAAAGLFERAITESSACSREMLTLQTAENRGSTFASKIGCNNPSTQVSCMYSQSVSSLLHGSTSLVPLAESLEGLIWFPNIRKAVLPDQLSSAIASGSFNQVPMMQGTNHDEGTIFVARAYDLTGHPLTASQYAVVLKSAFGATIAAKVLQQYPLKNYASASRALSVVLTDGIFSCSALSSDRSLAANVPIYAYEFNDPGAPATVKDPYMQLGDYHSAEMQYLFKMGTLPSKQLQLSNQMIAYWTNFARDGNPNGDKEAASLPTWKRYSTGLNNLLSLVPDSPQVEHNFASVHQCSFWARVTG